MRGCELLVSLACSVLVVACSEEGTPSQSSPADGLLPPSGLVLPEQGLPSAGFETSLKHPQARAITQSQAELDRQYVEARRQLMESAIPAGN